MNFEQKNFTKDKKTLFKGTLKAPLLEKSEEMYLTRMWYYKKDEKSFQRIILSHGRLVANIAFRYRYYNLNFSDLIQEGYLGLLNAAMRYNPEKEARFSSYAKWWIKAYIQDFILKNWSIVRTGSTTPQKIVFFSFNRMRSKLNELSDTLMSYEHLQEMAQALNVSLLDVTNMEKRLLNPDYSLSNHLTQESDEEWITFLPDDRPNPEEESTYQHDSKIQALWIRQAIEKSLSPREQFIIFKRRLQDPPETLENIGQSLGITKERVRQLELKALRRLKHFFVENFHEIRQIIDFDMYS